MSSSSFQNLVSETLKSVVSTEITESGYSSSNDELSLTKLIGQSLSDFEANSNNFDNNTWNSVFWDKEWLRPDRLTKVLNEEFAETIRKDLSSGKKSSEYQKKVQTQTGLSILGFGFKQKTSRSERTFSEKEYLEMTENIKTNKIKLEWNGEKFFIRPMKLHMFNTNS